MFCAAAALCKSLLCDAEGGQCSLGSDAFLFSEPFLSNEILFVFSLFLCHFFLFFVMFSIAFLFDDMINISVYVAYVFLCVCTL